MEEQGLLDVAAKLGVELAGVEGRIDIARIGVGVAIDGGSGAIQGLLHLFNPNQRRARSVGIVDGGGDVKGVSRMLAREADRFEGGLIGLSKHKVSPEDLAG